MHNDNHQNVRIGEQFVVDENKNEKHINGLCIYFSFSQIGIDSFHFDAIYDAFLTN